MSVHEKKFEVVAQSYEVVRVCSVRDMIGPISFGVAA